MLEKISFPEHEYDSVKKWLDKQGFCYTTRVFKEVGKYKDKPIFWKVFFLTTKYLKKFLIADVTL